jgi:hypothetical protein
MRGAKVEEFEFESECSLSFFLSSRLASSTNHIMIAKPAALRLTHSEADESTFPRSSGMRLLSSCRRTRSLVICGGVALQAPDPDFPASNYRQVEPSGMFLCAHNANQSPYEGA